MAWGIGCGEDNIPGVYASVSEGVCWIDLAMSCQAGYWGLPAPSHWGFPASSCQTWLDQRLTELSAKVDAMANAHMLSGRRKAAVLAEGYTAQKALEEYNKCSIAWVIDDETYTEPLNSNYNSQSMAETEPYNPAPNPEPEPSRVSQTYAEPESQTYSEQESNAYIKPVSESYLEPELSTETEPYSNPEPESESHSQSQNTGTDSYSHSENTGTELFSQSGHSQNTGTSLCSDPDQSFAAHPTNCQK